MAENDFVDRRDIGGGNQTKTTFTEKPLYPTQSTFNEDGKIVYQKSITF